MDYLSFVQQSFSLIKFLNESLGFNKIRSRLDSQEQANFDRLNFKKVLEDGDALRPVLRVFYSAQNYTDRPLAIKKNFPYFFSEQEQNLFTAESLLEQQKFEEAQRYLEKCEHISEQNLIKYFRVYFVPAHKTSIFLSIVYSHS